MSTRAIGVILTQSNIQDINVAFEAIKLFHEQYDNFRFFVFIQKHVLKSGLLNPASSKCYVRAFDNLKVFKKRNPDSVLFSGSAILGNGVSYVDKINCFYQRILEELASNNQGEHSINRDVSQDTFHIPKSLVWSSVFNPCDGYGSSAEQMIISLDECTDYEVVFRPHQVFNLHLADQRSKNIYTKSKATPLRNNRLVSSHYIYYAQPHECQIPFLFKGKTVNFTMWESSSIPVSWRKTMMNYSEIWTPSEWGANVMKECGVKRSIKVVPLGVNTKVFKYVKPTEKFKGPFSFLLYANSHWGNERKNYPQVLNAFRQAFGNSKDVQLILKLTEHSHNIPRYDNVKPTVARYQSGELVNMLHQAQCFIFVSSGEGWGLPPREAMACGVPTILGNTSALQDIAIDNLVWPVEPSGRKTPIDYNPIYGPKNQLGYLDTYSTGDIAEQMLAVYNNYRTACSKAEVAAKHIVSTQTYKHTAKHIVSLLEE